MMFCMDANAIMNSNNAFNGSFEKCQPQPVTSLLNGISENYARDEKSTSYECKLLSLANELATHSSASSQLPPRPRRPYTEYLVFFRLERELLLQGEADASSNLERTAAVQKIRKSGKDVEPSDVAALRPPQYRHLVMSVDWYVVGNKDKPVSNKLNDSPPSNDIKSITSTNAFKQRVTEKKATCGKFSFLELTKLISSKWKEVCQNDPVTKEFCKKIADSEANRYKKELGEYRDKYGVEAAKGKKRKPRKSKSSETRKKLKEAKERVIEQSDVLNNFIPLERDSEEETLVSPQSADLDDSTDESSMYFRQQEIQTQLIQTQGRTTSPPSSSSFTVNTFQGIPKDFSQALTYQGAIITPNSPLAKRYVQGRQMLQQRYDHLRSIMRSVQRQAFVRRNSAFDSKYDFLDSGDDDLINDKVEEHLREFERKVFQENVLNSPVCIGIDDDFYLKKFHEKHIDKLSCSLSEGWPDLASNQAEVIKVRSGATTPTPTAQKLKKLRSLQSNDWALFTENVEIR